MKKIVLKPRETMKRRRAKERLAIDADLIQDAVRSHPGIPSKAAIAAKTGLTIDRVSAVIDRINSEEVGGPRLDYGEAKAAGGPHAGKLVRGWFVMNRKAHHAAMDSADEHAATTELGIRHSRLVRLAQAHGIRYADSVVASILDRLGMTEEVMTESDLSAFMDLLREEAGEEAA
jgi:hypothetical protein